MHKQSFRGSVTTASIAIIVMTSCAAGDDGRPSASWGNASAAPPLTTAGVSATETEEGSTAPAGFTDGSESASAGTTSPGPDGGSTGTTTTDTSTSGTSTTSGTTTTDTSTSGTSFTSGTTATDTSASGTSTTSGASTSTSSGTTAEAVTATDAGADGSDSADGTTFAVDACTQVDFLFVIDGSLSMEDEQAALSVAFPAFLKTIKSTLPTSDYHIMVVDTDASGRCSAGDCSHASCQEANMHACMDIFDTCDTTRGAGVVHPAGAFSANKDCGFAAGRRFLLGSDPKLTEAFECAAKLGTAGDPSERPMDAMVEAVSAPLCGPGGCNEGFLRDDAILVVTFITDDDEVEDVNTAQQTYDALVAAKGGDADRIVMLGLIPGVGCKSGGLHWAQLIGLFGTHGIQGLVCSADYNGFFQDAVSAILDSCVVNPG